MLERAGKGLPGLWWYAYQPRCLVLGRGQRLSEVDLERCNACQLALVRRPSGGAAALADSSLLGLAIALPTSCHLVSSDVTASYAWLGGALAEAIRRLGAVDVRSLTPAEARDITAQFRKAAEVPELLSRACFGTCSPYEVVVARQKLAGLSQARRRDAVLYQVAVLIGSNAGETADYLSCPDLDRQELRWALETYSAGLFDLLGRAVTPDHIVETFSQVLGESHGVRLEPINWEAEDQTRAAALGAVETIFSPEGQLAIQASAM